LLIGFWFEKKSAADACKKAFITTRVGDLGFLIGLFMLAFYAGTFNYFEVFDVAASGAIPAGILTAAAIFIFCGAIGKSAQFPLHVWLPDAMEGPTPVSALIHAATMVVAGVYLVARTMPLFIQSADASMFVAIIGLITSLLAASIALVQVDIKRILAYSTVSQLGYMIMALGLYGYDTAVGGHSPGYYAGTFHLMTHAFFKGLLFLGAGSIIHAVHTNDIREMGGLLPKMKWTSITFIVASLSIAGIFPLSGFWSKDEIVAATANHPVFFVLTLLIAFMTAFYMFRLCFLTFFGKPRDQHRFDHAHESPRTMTWPLIFLGFLSIFAGWVGLPWLSHGFSTFVYAGKEAYHAHANWLLMFVSTVVAVSGIALAYLMYYKKSISAEKLGARFRPIYTLLYNKWYFDEIYDLLLIRPTLALGRFLWTFDARVIDGLVNGTAWFTMWWADAKMWFDEWIIDGAVNGTGWLVQKGAQFGRLLQSGRMQIYALVVITGTVFFSVTKFELSLTEFGLPTVTIVMIVGILVLSLLARFKPTTPDEQDTKSDK
jgi:NADH-quinone oxidoreductase subunit L